MSLYLIGDVQGCDEALQRLLVKLDFSPSRDTVVLLGDLVNRGPDSLAVLRRLRALDGSAQALLGNHDLHLLALAQGVRAPHHNDTLDALLRAPDAPALLEWLRHRPLALQVRDWLLVHAGLLPSWTPAQALELAGEVAEQLRGPEHPQLLRQMYGNQPDRWDPALRGMERWRVVINAMTRLRFCSADGVMEFATKDNAAAAPPGFMPWFEVPGRASAETRVAFGHWSTLGLRCEPRLLALDTGCVWGGQLSAARLDTDNGVPEVLQVPCPCVQRPGG